MLKIRWIVLAGILTYSVFLVATMPVHFLLNQFPELKQAGPVSLKSASGTVWHGRADARIRVPNVQLDLDIGWDFLSSQLLRGRLGFDLDIASQGLNLQARTAVSPSQIAVDNLDGVVQASFVNRIARPYQAEISGDVDFNQLSVLWHHKDKLAQEASGTITWPGGDVVGGGQSFNAPPLIGALNMKDEVLHFELFDQQMNKVYAEVEYQPTGWARVAVKKRIMELAGQNVDSRKAAQSVFEVKQKLF